MKSLLKTLLSTSYTELLKLTSNIFLAIKEMFCYFNNKRKDEKCKEDVKNRKEYEKKVDKVIDNGSIEDLLDLRK